MASMRSPWRGWLLGAGVLVAVAGILHPRGGTVAESLADPTWVPGHLAYLVGMLMLLAGILVHAREVPLPDAARRWARWAAAASALEAIEMVVHTAAVVDLENALAGRATPVFTTHFVLAMITYPIWGVTVTGWVVSTARAGALGTRWLAPLAAVGTLSYGFAPLVTTLVPDPALALLFPLIMLFAAWLLLAALWPTRLDAMLDDAAGSGSSRLLFQTMYRLGITPWDGHPLAAPIETIAREPRKGRALDLGCGTGDASVFLAREGWEVTGVDFVEVALDRARARAGEAGVRVHFVRGDVTRLTELGIGEGYRLIVDNGCLHGLAEADAAATARGIEAVAAPDARLVVSAFGKRKRRGPRGLDRADLERWFGATWEVTGGEPDPRVGLEDGDPIHVYELRRRARAGAGAAGAAARAGAVEPA